MVLGYENGLRLSTGFQSAPSQRGHVSAKERAMMRVLIYIIKLIIVVLMSVFR